jgi:N-acetylglucosamine-6-sulfatase
MIQNIDLAPTLLEVSGGKFPEGTIVDGNSFLPLLRGEQIPWRDEVLYEYYWEWNYPQTPTTLGLRSERYKYIFYHGVWGEDELFDLQEDPLEQRNLFYREEHQTTVREMRQKLFEMLEATDGMNIPLRIPQGFRGGDRGPGDR